MFIGLFGVGLLLIFLFLSFVVLPNLESHLLFNIVGGSLAQFVSKK